MSNFFLHTPTKKPAFHISHEDKIMLIGSCFTENMGEKLSGYKFDVIVNPFGIIYNPVSIANSLTRICQNRLYTEQELTQYNEKWLSFDHHGCFSSGSNVDCLTKINSEIESSHQQLQSAKTILITLGTAWVYESIETRKIVANCHKFPSQQFSKRLLLVDEVVTHLSAIIGSLENVQFIFTVSPVRHINDGLHENNISKSVLHLAIHNLLKKFGNCSYFPAYEIIMDELRDYRFFKEDMIHPTKQAINYVWEKFGEVYFNNQTQQLNQRIERIIQATQHQPFDFKSEKHQLFVSQQLRQIQLLENEFPFLNFNSEKKAIQSI